MQQQAMEVNTENKITFYTDKDGVHVYGRDDERNLMIKTANDGVKYLVPLNWIVQYPFFNGYEDSAEDEELELCTINYSVNDEKEMQKRVKEAVGVVGSKTMDLLIQYCGYTKLYGLRKEKLPQPIEDLEKYATEFEKEFIMNVDDDLLRDLVQDANFIGCEDFVGFLCALISTRISGKTVEEMRLYFEMESDFTPEEWKKVEEENAWIDQ